ncbi:unnamed protein product [Gongylonema pulchrum]|uniref:Transmembrane protein n=1 Tax=Gongylonema pulchrum TaxID=637853 RepID=A0A183EWG6_9BILA|nr:unnamed protein product [Gongylonema pulchrum]
MEVAAEEYQQHKQKQLGVTDAKTRAQVLLELRTLKEHQANPSDETGDRSGTKIAKVFISVILLFVLFSQHLFALSEHDHEPNLLLNNTSNERILSELAQDFHFFPFLARLLQPAQFRRQKVKLYLYPLLVSGRGTRK